LTFVDISAMRANFCMTF